MSNTIFDEIEDQTMKMVLNIHTCRPLESEHLRNSKYYREGVIDHARIPVSVLRLSNGRHSMTVVYDHIIERGDNHSTYGVNIIYFSKCKTDTHSGNMIELKMKFEDFEQGWEAEFELQGNKYGGKVSAFKPDTASNRRLDIQRQYAKKEGEVLTFNTLNPRSILEVSLTKAYEESKARLDQEVSVATQHLIENLFHRGVLTLHVSDAKSTLDECTNEPKIILGKQVTISFEGEKIIEELKNENMELRAEITKLQKQYNEAHEGFGDSDNIEDETQERN